MHSSMTPGMLVLLALAVLLQQATADAANATATSTASATTGPRRCPPLGFNSVPNLNLTAYISAPWYVQEQLPISFMGEDPYLDVYCVRAKYEPLAGPGGDPTQGLRVKNYANRGRVNGPAQGTSGVGNASRQANQFASFELVAVPDPAAAGTPQATSQLLVGPAFVLPALRSGRAPAGSGAGQYWVVAVGSRQGELSGAQVASQYDWAIISGGAPEVELTGGCSTQPPAPPRASNTSAHDTSRSVTASSGRDRPLLRALNTLHQRRSDDPSRPRNVSTGSGGGLWLFSRTPVDPAGARVMRGVAQDLGYDISGLIPVQQENCTYTGAE